MLFSWDGVEICLSGSVPGQWSNDHSFESLLSLVEDVKMVLNNYDLRCCPENKPPIFFLSFSLWFCIPLAQSFKECITDIFKINPFQTPFCQWGGPLYKDAKITKTTLEISSGMKQNIKNRATLLLGMGKHCEICLRRTRVCLNVFHLFSILLKPLE